MRGNNMEDEKKVYPVCKRCGRKLRTPEAKELGMGKICKAKYEKSTRISLFANIGRKVDKHELSEDNQE